MKDCNLKAVLRFLFVKEIESQQTVTVVCLTAWPVCQTKMVTLFFFQKLMSFQKGGLICSPAAYLHIEHL